VKLHAWIEGIGVIGPGLANWTQAADVLAQRAPYEAARTVLPAPASLPSAERRAPARSCARARRGHEAVDASGRDAATLASVFAASGGDGVNCHAICETLSTDDRQLSPTRFHNSVHNAAAGYWSIASRAATASVLCAHDAASAQACSKRSPGGRRPRADAAGRLRLRISRAAAHGARSPMRSAWRWCSRRRR
jgi:hypothetical protein